MTGKEVTSQAIGSVPYREGVFNTWNDPAKFGLFYHSALIMRREDVKPANDSYGIQVQDMSLTSERVPALSLITEKHKVGMSFLESANETNIMVSPNARLVEEEHGEVQSDTKELYRSWDKKIGWIDSERTKAIYGFVGSISKIDLTGASFEVKTDFATIAMSSLTDKPLEQSDNILLTTVGRSKNTGMRFNEDHTIMEDLGRPPILVEVVEAEIHLKTEISTLKVWAVNAEGFFAGVIPSVYENGILRFKLGERFASMYYLIQAE